VFIVPKNNQKQYKGIISAKKHWLVTSVASKNEQ